MEETDYIDRQIEYAENAVKNKIKLVNKARNRFVKCLSNGTPTIIIADLGYSYKMAKQDLSETYFTHIHYIEAETKTKVMKVMERTD